jgi:cysteinyl-tRNA synthetase
MLKVTNTLSGQKEVFQPLNPPQVKMYVCGPTVYGDIHIGNARCYVNFDVIRKYLVYSGFKVTYVVNITDIDDKIIKISIDEKRDAKEVAETYTKAYFEVLERLGVQKADIYPKATEYIKEMIGLVSGLLEKGHAYVVPSTDLGKDVMFDSTTFKSYGKLSGKNLEELQEGARVEKNDAKRNPTDFVLWKASKPGEPQWDSPWGKGRPGWHIECSSMVRKLLGDSIDIHGGGVDLIFPHHENEIAQCEAYTDKPYVKYWLHNGFIEIAGQKMSKSLGNIWKAKDALRDFRPEVLRYFFLSAHYRSGLNFDLATLKSCQRGWEEFNNTFIRGEQVLGLKSVSDYPMNLLELRLAVDEIESSFKNAMDDDFNTPKALASLFDLSKTIKNFLSEHTYINDAGKNILKESLNIMRRLAEILGIILNNKNKEKDSAALLEVKKLAGDRKLLKQEKKYKEADELREKIFNWGFIVEDVKNGEPIIVPIKDEEKYESVKNVLTDELLNGILNKFGGVKPLGPGKYQGFQTPPGVVEACERECWDRSIKFDDLIIFVKAVIHDFVSSKYTKSD